MRVALIAVAATFATTSAFTALSPRLVPSRALVAQPPCTAVAVAPRQLRAARHVRTSTVSMGLFGLGWAEIGVIGVLALLFFGPERLAPLAKDLGKSASGLKEVADSFAEGMSEGETGVSKDGGEQAIKSAAEPVPVEKKE